MIKEVMKEEKWCNHIIISQIRIKNYINMFLYLIAYEICLPIICLPFALFAKTLIVPLSCGPNMLIFIHTIYGCQSIVGQSQWHINAPIPSHYLFVFLHYSRYKSHTIVQKSQFHFTYSFLYSDISHQKLQAAPTHFHT